VFAIQTGKCDESMWKLLFHGWFINLKDNNNQYYAYKTLRSVPRDSVTGWEINDNIYIHYPIAADHKLGCSQIPWMWIIQVHSSWKLQVNWICSSLTGGGWVLWVEGGRSLLHIIPHGLAWAEIQSTTAFFVHGTLSTTTHWRIGHDSLYTRFLLVRHN
jgi:hypothetical protein